MHADTLYHRMLAQEKAVEDAKASGQPMPDFNDTNPNYQTPISITSLANAKSSNEEELPPPSIELTQKLKPEAQLELQERLKGLTPAEREVEVRSKLGEYEADKQVAREVHRLRASASEERRKRREEGTATVGDTINGWFGW